MEIVLRDVSTKVSCDGSLRLCIVGLHMGDLPSTLARLGFQTGAQRRNIAVSYNQGPHG